jgi:predicted Rdx family selenoprotein
VAALITQAVQVDPVLEPGGRGEFTVWVDGRKVAEKTRTGFPAEPAILDAVKHALE